MSVFGEDLLNSSQVKKVRTLKKLRMYHRKYCFSHTIKNTYQIRICENGLSTKITSTDFETDTIKKIKKVDTCLFLSVNFK